MINSYSWIEYLSRCSLNPVLYFTSGVHSISYCVYTGKPSAVTAQPVQPIKESSETKKTSTKPRRVVVTGMGLVSSLGHDANTYYDNLLAGKSGVSEIENFDCKEFPTVCLQAFQSVMEEYFGC